MANDKRKIATTIFLWHDQEGLSEEQYFEMLEAASHWLRQVIIVFDYKGNTWYCIAPYQVPLATLEYMIDNSD